MFQFVIGLLLAVLIIILGKLTKFEQDRSFYSTVLIVIASYYVLFSFISFESIFIEISIAFIFIIFAVVGALRWPLLIGLGLFTHGIFDFYHVKFINNSGVPVWWPSFCAGIDIILGIWVLYLFKVKHYFEINSQNHAS